MKIPGFLEVLNFRTKTWSLEVLCRYLSSWLPERHLSFQQLTNISSVFRKLKFGPWNMNFYNIRPSGLIAGDGLLILIRRVEYLQHFHFKAHTFGVKNKIKDQILLISGKWLFSKHGKTRFEFSLQQPSKIKISHFTFNLASRQEMASGCNGIWSWTLGQGYKMFQKKSKRHIQLKKRLQNELKAEKAEHKTN